MKPEEIPMVDTWGRRLSREAQQLMVKHMPQLNWLRELSPLLDRITSLPVPAQERFRRVETEGSQQLKRLINEPDINDESTLLPPTAREQLALSDIRSQDVHIHTGSKADEIAREHKADAVTMNQNVYFRQNRYRPQDRVGLALLAHELEHIIAALRPNTAWRRATMIGIEDEEERALLRERQILDVPQLGSLRFPPENSKSIHKPDKSQLAQSMSPTISIVTPLQRPMKAEATRNTSTQMSAPPGGSTHIDTLRQELYRDLLSQIRSDLERGA